MKRALEELREAVRDFQLSGADYHNKKTSNDDYEKAREMQRRLAGEFLEKVFALASDCLVLFNVCTKFLDE